MTKKYNRPSKGWKKRLLHGRSWAREKKDYISGAIIQIYPKRFGYRNNIPRIKYGTIVEAHKNGQIEFIYDDETEISVLPWYRIKVIE